MFRVLSTGVAIVLGFVLAIPAVAVPDGMLLYLPFDDGTAKDASGNGRDGVLTGGKTVDAKLGKGIELAGPDEIQIEDDGSLDGMSALTAEVWVWMKLHQATGLIQKGSDWGANMSYLIQPWSDQQIYFGIKETSSRAITKPGDFPLSEWYHLAAVFDGADLRLYINGKKMAEAPAPAGVKAVPDTDNPIQLGNRFTGIVDEFILYERALSEDEIARDMNGEVLAVEARGKLATYWATLRLR